MTILLTILIAIISAALIFMVLLQNPKGGGINSAFGGSQLAGGLFSPATTNNMLEKITAGLGGALIILCIFMTFTLDKSNKSSFTPEINTTTTTSVPMAPVQGDPNNQ